MEQIDNDSARTARCLLRSARVGTLATSAKGQPFASLVTPACAPDLSLLLLLSGLSEHTRHLMADPRCSVLVVGVAETANPQTAPRLTVTGVAERVASPELKSRYLAVHPYASLYADFGDFAVWRMQPVAGLFVGGFARAIRLPRQALTPDPESVTAIATAEAGIIAHCNRDHPDAHGGNRRPARRLADGDGRCGWLRPGTRRACAARRLVRTGACACRCAAGTGVDDPAGPSDLGEISLTLIAERPQADEIACETTGRAFPLDVTALWQLHRPAGRTNPVTE